MGLFAEPKRGGLTAYLNANELDPPPEFCFDPYLGDDPRLSRLPVTFGGVLVSATGHPEFHSD